MKIQKVILAGIIVLTGCATNTSVDNENFTTVTSLPEIHGSKEIIPAGIEIELEHAYTPEYLIEICDSVVLARVDRITGTDLKTNDIIGFTDGIAKVIDVIYGDNLPLEFSFKKPGCIVSASEYEESYSEEEMTKIIYLREKNGYPENFENLYYDTTLDNDIHIEDGKVYLMYLHYIQTLDQYEIIGLGNGLKEITNYQDGVSYDELYILDNESRKSENLKDYIDTNISAVH